jgi:hypothetical protein
LEWLRTVRRIVVPMKELRICQSGEEEMERHKAEGGTDGITKAPMTTRFWSVFLTSHVDESRTEIITTPSTMASSCVWSTEKWNPEIMIFANAPRPEVGRVVQMAITQ